MSGERTPSHAPVGPSERVEVMDVLRGVALFGVFLMNMAPFAGTPIMATEQQLLSLPTAAYDFALLDVLRWLVADKANTIFAFLFGLGFYLQMQRLQFRGADFEALYKRRLTVLLCIGCVHLLLCVDLGHPASLRARRFHPAAATTPLEPGSARHRHHPRTGGTHGTEDSRGVRPGIQLDRLARRICGRRHLVAPADLRERRLLWHWSATSSSGWSSTISRAA